MTGRVDARLKELDITLPKAVAPVANYVPFVITGNLVFISGQVTLGPNGLEYVGQVGKDFTVEDAVSLFEQGFDALKARARVPRFDYLGTTPGASLTSRRLVDSVPVTLKA